jgi:1,2-diacylglycerol 3-beta-galactosyltransferase
VNPPQNNRPHVLFLFSDTGGGHRSAAEAIIEALNVEFPRQISTEMIDIFREYAPSPMDLLPRAYPPMAHVPDVWELGYHLSDGPRRTRAINRMFWPYISRAAYRLVEEHPCDLYVLVHWAANTPLLRALGSEKHTPIFTVVTDMVSTHAFWYQPGVDLVIVATEQARHRALFYGLKPEKVRVVGLPVADRFCQPLGDRQAIRTELGWPIDLPVILLVGGGDGMGPLERTATAVADAGLKVAMVVVAGRNRKLKTRLESQNWPIPTFIYGFVRDMPDFMRAADILVTKAGPGTICEAFIAGLPLILYSRMPGQEDGNVDFVVSEKAGIWAPEPDQVVECLHNWLDHPAERKRVAAASLSLARPDASRQIARLIAEQLSITAPLSISDAG